MCLSCPDTGGGRYAFADWAEALERLFAVVTDGLIVIDEFPYLSKASPSLPSLLQHALDPRGAARQGNSRLLLCGSAMSVMGRLLAGNATRGGIASHIGRKSPDIGHPLAVLEDSQLITREIDPFRKGRSFYRICEPLIVFYEAVMRREWTRLERREQEQAWRNSRATFLTQVVGPHYEGLCRDWAMSAGADVFDDLPGTVAAGVIADPVNRTHIEVDVAVLAPEDSGRPRRVLSLGEAKWDKVMTMGHLDRLRRARDLLAVKGYNTADTALACYGGEGFDEELRAAARADRRVLLVGPADLYG